MIGYLKTVSQGIVSAASSLLWAGIDQVQAALDDFSACSPALEQIGYRLNTIEIVAVPPRLVIELFRDRAVPAEAYTAVLANHPNNKTFRLVVSLLQKADQSIEHLKVAGRTCSKVIVDLGIPPSFRLVYGNSTTGNG